MGEKIEPKYDEVPQNEENAAKDKEQTEGGGAVRLQAKMSLLNGNSCIFFFYSFPRKQCSSIQRCNRYCWQYHRFWNFHLPDRCLGSNWKREYGIDRLGCVG